MSLNYPRAGCRGGGAGKFTGWPRCWPWSCSRPVARAFKVHREADIYAVGTQRQPPGRAQIGPGATIWWQTQIYHTAPEIGHFVSREDVYAARPGRRIRLTKAGR